MSRVRVVRVSKRFKPGDALFSARKGGRSLARWKEYYGEDFRAASQDEDFLEERQASRDIVALDDVSLDIADGETISVIGPSGCGKTTLLRVIAGLETPDSGRVYYDDVDVTETAPGDRGIGIVFQNYALYPHMRSKGNLAFFFRMHRREREIDDRVRITSEIMGLGFDALLDRKPKELSGGQRQRVAIGRCIVRDPKLFLFDEPLSSLDAKLRAKTRVEVKRLIARFKITSIYVTHDQIEAIALADRIALMRHGRIEQLGTYWDLHDRPINQFVGGFLGTPPMNFVPGTVVGHQVSMAFGVANIPESVRSRLHMGQQVTVGIRPRSVALNAPEASGDARGVVGVVEPIPSDRVQIVHLMTVEQELTGVVPLEPGLQCGDSVSVRFDPAGVHIFDRETEGNLAL